LAGPAWAGMADDDLAVVKKALASTSVQDATPAPPPAPAKPVTAPPRKGDKPQWLRVRVTEKGAKKGKVSINVPLALAQAIGDDLPVDWKCHHHRGEHESHEDGGHHERCTLKLGDVLAMLAAGESLVEIDDEDASVRVWVD